MWSADPAGLAARVEAALTPMASYGIQVTKPPPTPPTLTLKPPNPLETPPSPLPEESCRYVVPIPSIWCRAQVVRPEEMLVEFVPPVRLFCCKRNAPSVSTLVRSLSHHRCRCCRR